MNFKTRRILAALSAAVCAASTAAAMPVIAEDKPGVTAVYATDFEDGDVSAFSKRGDTDTSVLGTAEDADAPSGKTVMTVTDPDRAAWKEFAEETNAPYLEKYTEAAALKK